MAMYFNGASEIQADGLQTLYLMNPGYVGYSDAQPPENLAFLNSAGNSLTPASLSHIQHQNRQQFHGIPLQPTTVAPSSASQHEISALNVHGFVPRVHYNLWRSVDPTTSSASQEQHQIPATESPANNSLGNFDFTSQLGLRRSVIQPGQQGLSLSLSPQQSNYGSYQPESDIPAPEISPARGDEMRISGGSGSSVSAISNGISGMQSILLGSKYLKVTQELLDEVVNVGKEIKSESSKGIKTEMKISKDSYSATGESSNGGGTGAKPGTELTTAERQELQMKKAKLITMLDEVEQRYRQYHHQMQIVVASFEQAAGFGSAKTYTALALQTISKQFRCLKDAISSQIKATSKNLGEEDCLGGKNHTSRLRLIDHQLRQQRALQQLGMIQHNAWRPQRGLPERSVSVLRAWLFEHFLHPYPKDSDKHLLAKQTGLTRSQVSNWFINARVRLWKPMVEEMYMEEIKDREQIGSEDKTTKNVHNEESGSKSTAPQENSPIRKDQIKNLKSKQDNFTIKNASSIENISSTVTPFTMEGFVEQSPKKQRSNDLNNSPISIPLIMDMEVKPEGEISNKELYAKFGNERQSWDSYSLFAGTENNGRFGAYAIGEMSRFDSEEYTPRLSGNGVALTLGLPHCENLSLAGTQQSYLSNHNTQFGRRLNMGGSERNDFCEINTPPPSHSTTGYETINMQNRKRFAAQLLPDFVA